MAKLRVYELAKELNVESKKLVEELQASGMDVKNYMSSLSEDDIKKAKDIVMGTVSEVIEERRIKSNVIRRRKKTVQVEAEKPEEKREEKPQEKPLVTKEIPEKEDLPGKKPLKKAVKEIESPSVEEEIKEDEAQPVLKEEEALPPPPEIEPVQDEPVVEKPAQEREKKKEKKPKKKTAYQPARIIKRAEEGPLRELLAKKEAEKIKPAATPAPIPEREPEQIDAAQLVVEDKKEKLGKKKKEKKKAAEAELVKKGTIKHRKIEIFEKADLYEGRGPRAKEKKGGKKVQPARQRQTELTTPRAIKRRIRVQEIVTISELAKAMGIKAIQLIKRLLEAGITANINQTIDFETASLVAEDFGYELELDRFEMESEVEEKADKPEDLMPRPPVVTIMGHVDHGKTSLLDYIRKSNIISGEAGGITQHIGAYFVETPGGDITFLDTPGHEAFTAMRARGAQVTDIIILVVAADDGVMPQTREAVNHAKAAKIPIVVAVNKIDKPNANPDKVKRELAELELVSEEWGGETLLGYISAKTGQGVDELLDLILLQAEMLELKANPNKMARGTIIEAKLDKSRGPLATVLIDSGTLKQSDFFVCGEHYGKIRAMSNHRGQRMIQAGPSMPVEIYGISGVPMAGDQLVVVKDEKTAKEITYHRQNQTRAKEAAGRDIVSLDDLYERIKQGAIKELNIIIKADVQGSLEALTDSLLKLSTEEVKLVIIHSSTGAITESDIMLASASGAIVLGFNVRANPRVMEVAHREKIDVRYYDIIYNAIEAVRLAMQGLLEPVIEEHVIGRADIKEIFRVPRIGTVSGCYVTSGHIERNARVRLLRDDVVIYDGNMASLRRFKEDVKEVATGYECGIGLENFQDVKPGDVVEAYKTEEVQAEL